MIPPVLLILAALGLIALAFKSEKVADATATVIDDVQAKVADVTASLVQIFGTDYDDLIRDSASQSGIEYDVLWRLLYAESRFRPDIITGQVASSAGAQGIAQFMPATARELGIDPLDPAQAIPAAAKYLAGLVARLGNLDAGVAAYNWGIGNVQRKGLAKAPPETVKYVQSITGVDIHGLA